MTGKKKFMLYRNVTRLFTAPTRKMCINSEANVWVNSHAQPRPPHQPPAVTGAASRSGSRGEIVLNFNFRDTYKFPQSAAANYGPGI